jgi:hypothetical protein
MQEQQYARTRAFIAPLPQPHHAKKKLSDQRLCRNESRFEFDRLYSRGDVDPVSEVKQLKAPIRELQCLMGKKTHNKKVAIQ